MASLPNRLAKYFFLFALLAGSAYSETITGKVVGISDGDTITVLSPQHEQFKIRLSGIDAPEKAQPFGQRSKEKMSDLVFDKPVTVVWNKRDRYRRLNATPVRAVAVEGTVMQRNRERKHV